MSTHSVHQFAEKVAVISDVSDPIARAAALQLGLLGAFVVAGSAAATEEGTRAMEELRSLGTLAAFVAADAATDAGAEKLVAEAANSFGRIDLLVNCPEFSPTTALAGSAIETVSSQRLFAAQLLINKAFPLMENRPRPKVVNVISAFSEALKDPIFAAEQAALEAYTHSLSRSVPTKFRVNCVAADLGTPPEETDELQLFRPTGTLSPDDAARVIVFLLSSEAIAINGQTIRAG